MESDKKHGSGVYVAIRGSRMHYAIPRQLSERGLLSQFFTDTYFYDGIARDMIQGISPRIIPTWLRRLSGRNANLPNSIVKSYPLDDLLFRLKVKRVEDPNKRISLQSEAAAKFNRRVIRDLNAGLGSAIYCINGDALEIFQNCREIGIRCLLEQCIVPQRTQYELLSRKFIRSRGHTSFGAWDVERAAAREEAEWRLADLIITPSEFVRDSMVTLGVPPGKIVVVPYGVDTDAFPCRVRKPKNPHLNLLFVGAATVRKGIFELLDAARRVGSCIELRIIGHAEEQISRLAGAESNVRLLGKVARSEIVEHFEWADIFVLPTLMEGSATVIYEALACGIPVITTPNAGSLVRHGHDGLIVEPGDTEGLVNAILELASNHLEITRMSLNAIEGRDRLSVSSYSERLINAISEH
ncbi:MULTISPECIES: glycosyltransferase family 4 protein [Cupriavidus]